MLIFSGLGCKYLSLHNHLMICTEITQGMQTNALNLDVSQLLYLEKFDIHFYVAFQYPQTNTLA